MKGRSQGEGPGPRALPLGAPLDRIREGSRLDGAGRDGKEQDEAAVTNQRVSLPVPYYHILCTRSSIDYSIFAGF